MRFEAFPIFKKTDRTISALLCDGSFICFLMEDVIRDVPGKPVAEWKVDRETAIPRRTYPIFLADSPRFGPETITIDPVEGFAGIRVHANAKSDAISHRSSEGCPIPGMKIIELPGHDLRLTEDEAAARLLKRMLDEARRGGDKATITFYGGPQ